MDGRKMGWGKDGGGRSDALDKAIAVGNALVPGWFNPSAVVGQPSLPQVRRSPVHRLGATQTACLSPYLAAGCVRAAQAATV